jgi:predicted signal transduction protein with EAL and GGDEF domain
MKQTVSVGVSAYPEDGSRPADIFRRADSAMTRAKKAGRNNVCLAREEKLIPKTSHYTQAQLEKLSMVSDKLNVGEAALLREALDVLLKLYDIDETTAG